MAHGDKEPFTKYLESETKISQRVWLSIFFLAFITRIFFSFYAQKILWGDYRFAYADTPTYLDSFRNLIDLGNFCFNQKSEDSCFYRMPTYPFFLGFFYSIFPGMEWAVIAVVQAVLDSFTCIIAVTIAMHFGASPIAGVIVGLYFAANPLQIFWVPIQYPEMIGLFLIATAILCILKIENWKISAVASAALLLLSVWSKQYALVFVLFAPLLAASRKPKTPLILFCVLFFLSFSLLHATWLIRNYANYGKLYLFTGKTTGAAHYLADYKEAMKFTSIISENNTPILERIATEGSLSLPKTSFYLRHQEQILNAVRKAYECGPSFVIRRNAALLENDTFTPCENEVADQFTDLYTMARREMSVAEFYDSSVEALKKAFLKIPTSSVHGSSTLQALVFYIRFIVIVAGFAYIFAAFSKEAYFFWLYTVACWMVTALVLSLKFHIEMRYLLWVDFLLSIMGIMGLALFVKSAYAWLIKHRIA